jgi:hypothetical protein
MTGCSIGIVDIGRIVSQIDPPIVIPRIIPVAVADESQHGMVLTAYASDEGAHALMTLEQSFADESLYAMSNGPAIYR